MKTLSKFIVYIICLQLTVGSYPLLLQTAYAQDDRSPTTIDETNDVSRSPASDDLSMNADEWFSNFEIRKNFLEAYCKDQKSGNIDGRKAITDANSIGGDGKIVNCDGLAEELQKDLPTAELIWQEYLAAKAAGSCSAADCSSPTDKKLNMTLGQVEDRNAIREDSCVAPDATGKERLKSIEDQRKFAAEKCDFGCAWAGAIHVQGFVDGCSADQKSGSTGKCVANLSVEIGKGLLEGLKMIVFGIPMMIWGAGKWLFTKSESATSEKAQAMAGLNDKDLAYIYSAGKADPKKLEETFLQKAWSTMKEIFASLAGKEEFQEKGKCTDCSGKADLMCEVLGNRVGNAVGLYLSFFKNGYIFGMAKGAGSGIASRFMKLSKGTGFWSKTASKTITTVQSVATKTASVGKWMGKLIPANNIFVRGAAKLSEKTAIVWAKFKGTAFYGKLKNYTAIITSDSKTFKATMASKKGMSGIPPKISLIVGRGVSKTFKRISAYEDRQYVKGVGVFNNNLQKTMLRAQNIKKIGELRNARINELQQKGDIPGSTTASLEEVDHLVVAKDAGDARPTEELAEIKNKILPDSKKVASNNISGLKMKHLEDSENADINVFEINNKKDGINIDTGTDIKPIKFANPGEVESVRTYQDGKYAIVQKKDGSYTFHDLEGKETQLAVIPKEKAEYVDALLGKKTPQYEALEGRAYEQVKTNLKLNGTKYWEEVDAEGNKILKIETPKGCNPKVVRFSAGGLAI